MREGIDKSAVHVTGNTVIDALLWVKNRLDDDADLGLVQRKRFGAMLRDEARLVLITGHRRERFGTGFERICRAIRSLASAFPDVDFIYPVHFNPNVQEPVNRMLGGLANVHMIAPTDYLPFVYLMGRSCLILTDSGGIQEEAPSLGKPVLVMRDTTERPEAIAAGSARLVGTDDQSIRAAVAELLSDPDACRAMAVTHNPYGDGKACERIVAALKSQGWQ